MNWEQIGEFLPLLIFLALWSLGKFFSKGEKDEENAPEPEYYETEDDPTYNESIEEQICRKIQDRQGEGALLNEPRAIQKSSEVIPETAEAPTLRPPVVIPLEEKRQEDQDRFAKQKRRLRATQLSAQKLQKQLTQLSPAKSQGISQHRVSQPATGTPYGMEAWHRNPDSLRQAFIHYEIFGAPLSLRRSDGSFRPLWQE